MTKAISNALIVLFVLTSDNVVRARFFLITSDSHSCALEKFMLTVTYSADGKISVGYSAGDDVCGNGVKAKTVIKLSCGSTVGHPALIR